jgi:transcriptional regulator with XRE-family HTH domain
MTQGSGPPTIGQKLKDMRKKSGMTQKVLAKKLNISVRTLQFYEDDTSDIPTRKLIAACIYCNCDIMGLLEDFLPARLLSGTKAAKSDPSETTERTIKK